MAKKTKTIRSNHNVLKKRVGLKIHKYLFENGKPIEWLSFKSGVARSSIREIIAGRSNPRLLTLLAICKAIGYDSVGAFLSEIEKS